MRLILTLLLLLPAVSAGAQQLAGAYKLSSGEDVAIAYFKTGGKQPPFESWIRKNEPYKSTAPYLRPGVLQKEKQRLKAAWQSFDPARNVITIAAKTRASVHMMPATSAETHPRYELQFDFIDGNPSYFPYTFLGEHYAVIPEKQDAVAKQSIPEDRYNYLAQALPAPEAGAPLTLIIRLSPTRAEMIKPIRADGLTQWPLLVKVASLSLWNENGALLWETMTAASLAPQSNDLMNLKQNYRPYTP